jgi:glycine/D-amino acid oxidase-like deaminating enzyme
LTTSEPDILIIGQGLAGSLLAWELESRGCRALVVDDHHRGCASMAAAGLISTVTGKRMVLQNRVDELLPAARTRYRSLERDLGVPLLHEMPVLRLFVDETQRETFRRRQANPAYAAYLGPEASSDELAGLVVPFGGGWIHGTGYLDTRPLLAALRRWLRDRDRLVETAIDPADVRTDGKRIRSGELSAGKIVFCDGYRAITNPWFRHLPWAGAKGEILELRLSSSSPLPAAILNWGNWLAPRTDGTFRLGATHSWDPLDEQATATARQHLLDDLAARIPGIQAEIIRHSVGIRPATSTRQPLLGHSPRTPRILIFNGFGAKGGLLIPWHARAMADHLCDGVPLPESSDITRYG